MAIVSLPMQQSKCTDFKSLLWYTLYGSHRNTLQEAHQQCNLCLRPSSQRSSSPSACSISPPTSCSSPSPCSSSWSTAALHTFLIRPTLGLLLQGKILHLFQLSLTGQCQMPGSNLSWLLQKLRHWSFGANTWVQLQEHPACVPGPH